MYAQPNVYVNHHHQQIIIRSTSSMAVKYGIFYWMKLFYRLTLIMYLVNIISIISPNEWIWCDDSLIVRTGNVFTETINGNGGNIDGEFIDCFFSGFRLFSLVRFIPSNKDHARTSFSLFDFRIFTYQRTGALKINNIFIVYTFYYLFMFIVHWPLLIHCINRAFYSLSQSPTVRKWMNLFSISNGLFIIRK